MDKMYDVSFFNYMKLPNCCGITKNKTVRGVWAVNTQLSVFLSCFIPYTIAMFYIALYSNPVVFNERTKKQKKFFTCPSSNHAQMFRRLNLCGCLLLRFDFKHSYSVNHSVIIILQQIQKKKPYTAHNSFSSYTHKMACCILFKIPKIEP